MSSPYLFDASSVVDIILGRGATDIGIDVLFDEYWLDLTRYEAANAIWKIGFARDEVRDSEIDTAVDILDRLEHEMELESGTATSTMTVARENGLTCYDASYLAVAQREDFTLVSEDSALRDAAATRGVETAQIQTFV